jgi:hypothetical protein
MHELYYFVGIVDAIGLVVINFLYVLIVQKVHNILKNVESQANAVYI